MRHDSAGDDEMADKDRISRCRLKGCDVGE